MKKKKGRKGGRCLASLLLLLILASPAFAGDYKTEEPTPPPFVDTDTDTYADREQFTYGAGVDLVLIDTDMWWLDEVTAEGRYNVETEDYSAFGVVKVNVAKLLGGK